MYHSHWNIRRSTEGQFTRQKRTALSQIRTGHCVLLKAYMKRIGLEDDGLCETCKIKEEDREHLLGKCPAWSQERWETFGKTFLSHRELNKADPADIIAFLRRIGWLPTNNRWGNSTTTTNTIAWLITAIVWLILHWFGLWHDCNGHCYSDKFTAVSTASGT